MGGLSHYIEDEGIATTHISLIREHTEVIKPPRTLWVPFELGRPLGAPNDADFQKRVLRNTLKLLEADAGPILVDYTEEAPVAETDQKPVACPVNFALPPNPDTPVENLISNFKQEVDQMRAWYDTAIEKHGRTTSGATGLSAEETAAFIIAFVQGERQNKRMPDLVLSTALRMAAQDLKAYYLEAVAAQPGQPTDSTSLSDWFWGQTAAARMINEVRKICLESGDKDLNLLGKLLLVPRSQLHRFKAS
ncbi:MAG: hypothetical protein P1P89_08190 [Desulfobacterales bacterium]|nr:hypothetical protein [Desulfobacterales bacterium]